MIFLDNASTTPCDAESAELIKQELTTDYFNPSAKYTEALTASKKLDTARKELLGLVVSEGTGKNGQVVGFSVGGKTATSQKLPRSARKYIASFIGFSPVENPEIIGIIMIDEPEGTYYGGTIAAPVMSEIYEMVLPYLFPENKQETVIETQFEQ